MILGIIYLHPDTDATPMIASVRHLVDREGGVSTMHSPKGVLVVFSFRSTTALDWGRADSIFSNITGRISCDPTFAAQWVRHPALARTHSGEDLEDRLWGLPHPILRVEDDPELTP